jgi:hypothetical protein
VLAANQDWLVTVRDLRHEAAAECDARMTKTQAGGRVLVALHRGSAAATLDVPTQETWMEGCRLAKPMLDPGGATVTEEGGSLQLRLGGNDVLMAACE